MLLSVKHGAGLYEQQFGPAIALLGHIMGKEY